jgi:tetratricopeptide (TPR) repeat protein
MERIEEAHKIYDLIIEKNFIPDSETYANLFRVYAYLRDYQKAIAIYQVNSNPYSHDFVFVSDHYKI